jgi:hypothetical protein
MQVSAENRTSNAEAVYTEKRKEKIAEPNAEVPCIEAPEASLPKKRNCAIVKRKWLGMRGWSSL